jgi:hypothetical protein
MGKKSLCHCGSGRIKEFCCEKGTQIRVTAIPIENPKEHQEFLNKLQISSQFGMRYRGLIEFYGNDLIAYKLKHRWDLSCNEFLRILAEYLTNYLEDHCPPSWQQCQPSFWEELIITYYPYCMKISPQEKEVETFLSQLKKIVRWLDGRAHTSWYEIIEKAILKFHSELKICEHLLNSLMLMDFPNIHQNDWNHKEDLEKSQQKYLNFTKTVSGLFQVTSIIDDTIVLTDLKTERTYQIKGLPHTMITPGILLQGIIGKNVGAMFWNWHHTEGVYPEAAIDYFTFVS